MSDNDELFWNLVDEFIERANARCDDADPSMVSAALLQAAARFNAFTVAGASVDKKEYTEEIEPSLRYLTNQYRDILRDNLEDYRENYKGYMRSDEDE